MSAALPAAGPRSRAAGWVVRRTARAPRSLGRVLASAATVFLLSSLLTFALGAVSDANPAAAVLGETATPADIARMDHEFGLDRPLWAQFGSWLGHAVRGDLGRSWFTTLPVADSISAALPVDLSIAGLALLFAVLLGAAAGIAAALRPGTRLDRSVTALCTLLGTLPAFVVAIGLITLVSVQLRLLPSGGYVPLGQDPGQWLRFALLPALALSLDAAAGIARQLRTSLVGALRENWATGATMRGLSGRRVLFGHVLRNAAGPAVTVLGMSVPMLIGGAVVTERIFNLPGIAQLSLQAAEQHDVPVIQGTLLVTVVVVLVANLAVDAGLLALNPAARRRPAGAGAR
ncbi:peptide/nickel transport system permease protein [Kitasatospora sp. SolWspMP-SS2h]|uniref:ABC transporter permease n=1 Tax=Kitasatospora sp. SolWspMP-SS2h TaxID=1305729 RepID=UPI000DBA7A9F|nr:ABC transporter permease [Kitasatospora sp. SolWspMP-SS2h]RAJ47186.1 peptide/nickel transport system permease protein [Kitasatospora sp. SolWspMP-SS2h]